MQQNQKLIIQVPKELLEKIDDYRFKNRIHSRAETVRQLIETSLHCSKKKAPKS